MLFNRNLLTASLVSLLAVSVQSVALAGGHHGGLASKGGSGNMSRPAMTRAPQVTKSVMPQQTLKAPQFHVNQNTTLLQKGNFPQNTNMGNANKVNPLHKVGPVLSPRTESTMKTVKIPGLNVKPNFPIKPQVLDTKFHGKLDGVKIPGLDVGQPKPNFPIKGKIPGLDVGQGTPNIPIKPFPFPTKPPQGGGNGGTGGKCGTGYCGSGGYWGQGCGFGWNLGCSNWGYGNCGCGYWPGYFGNCGYYPYTVYTPTYFCQTPVVQVVPMPTTVVLNDVAVPPMPAAPASVREIDLAVQNVQLLQAATTSQGALYRITIANKGPVNLDVATRVAALGIKESRPDDQSPRAMETLQSLKVNETADLDLRMPVAANDLPRLLVAVEIPDGFKDLDDSNNVAAGEVTQLAAAK